MGQRSLIQSLLLSSLVLAGVDSNRAQAQPEPLVIPPPGRSPMTQLSCASPYEFSTPVLPSASGLPTLPQIPPPPSIPAPVFAAPGRNRSVYPGKQFIPIVAAYAKANLPQQEADLIAQLQQLARSTDAPSNALLWANLFDAYVEVEAYPQAIAAFNQIESAPNLLLSFVQDIAKQRPAPATIRLLPTLETLIEQHLSTQTVAKRQALISLMTTYHSAGLKSKSQAIAQPLLTPEPNLFTESADVLTLSLAAEYSNIALIAGDTSRAGSILQKLLATANSPQFRNIAGMVGGRDHELGLKAKFLIELARQLTEAGQSRQAVPLLDQATQWLQQKQDLAFYRNSQAKTVILTYAAAGQTATALRLLRTLQPDAWFQSTVHKALVEQAFADGRTDSAVQILQALPPSENEVSLAYQSAIAEFAKAGEFATAQQLVAILPPYAQDAAWTAIATQAVLARQTDLAEKVVQQSAAAKIGISLTPLALAQVWMDVATELTKQQQTTPAIAVLDRAAQLLEQIPAQNQSEVIVQRGWLKLADHYAKAGQRDRALALVNQIWQQVQSSPSLLEINSSQPLPTLNRILPLSETKTGVPALSWRVLYSVPPIPAPLPPRSPLPQIPTLPSPQYIPRAKSLGQKQPQAIAQTPLPQLPAPLLQVNATRLPDGYDAINRAIVAEHYLQAGNVSQAIALFDGIPEKYCNFKRQSATPLLNAALDSGYPEAAEAFLSRAYPETAATEQAMEWQLADQLEQWVQIGLLYSQQGQTESAAKALQQAELLGNRLLSLRRGTSDSL